MNLLPQILGDEKADRTKLFGTYIKSLVAILDVLRYNEFERSVVDVARVYSQVTGNTTVAALCAHGSFREMDELRPEMFQFVRVRLIQLIEDAIEVIQLHSCPDDKQNNIIGPLPRNNVNVTDRTLTMSELRLMEYEVLRACEHLESHCKHPDSRVENSQMADLSSTLQTWIHRFSALSKRVKYSTSRTRAFERPDANNDSESVNVIVLMGHLIAHMALSILLAKMCGSLDLSDCREEAIKTLAFEEYTGYSNIGTMSIAGILCCYGYTKSLPVAVLNPEGSLGRKERELLADLLIVSKLTKRD